MSLLLLFSEASAPPDDVTATEQPDAVLRLRDLPEGFIWHGPPRKREYEFVARGGIRCATLTAGVEYHRQELDDDEALVALMEGE